MKRSLVLAACAAALMLPASAVAASCAPPGNSGVSQYFETVPGAGCNRAPGSSGGHGGGLSGPAARRLAAQGAAGRAVAQLIAGNTPAVARSSPHGGGALSSSQAPASRGASPLSALLHPILHGPGSGGSGWLLPAFLAVVLALMLGLAARTAVRRRRLSP